MTWELRGHRLLHAGEVHESSQAESVVVIVVAVVVIIGLVACLVCAMRKPKKRERRELRNKPDDEAPEVAALPEINEPEKEPEKVARTEPPPVSDKIEEPVVA